jgi:amino-acid N-acetyltransferase
MRTPTLEQLPEITTLLAESGLPTDDLPEQDLSLFRVEGPIERLVAVGGLERCGNVALIRSVTTMPAMRGRGFATMLVEELERIAADKGFWSLYLLTETAEHFFESRGYSVLDRSDVPAVIRETRQFSSLCPDSAKVMCKTIGP